MVEGLTCFRVDISLNLWGYVKAPFIFPHRTVLYFPAAPQHNLQYFSFPPKPALAGLFVDGVKNIEA
jgi:hypothetical protein